MIRRDARGFEKWKKGLREAERRSVFDHINDHPPFTERLPNGVLSPEFGSSSSEWNHRHSLHGLRGFWTECWKCGGLNGEHKPGCTEEEAMDSTPPPQARERRFDHDKIARLVKYHSPDLTKRELEVFFGFYRDGKTKGAIALELGLAPGRVDNILAQLRAKAKRYSRHPRGQLAVGSTTPEDGGGGTP